METHFLLGHTFLLSVFWLTANACYMSMSDLQPRSGTDPTRSPPSHPASELQESELFRAFRLGAVQEKMLAGLGLSAPPRFAMRPRNDVRRLNMPRLPLRSMQELPDDNRHQRALIFADLGSHSHCRFPASNLTRTSTTVSFKLPYPPMIIRNATFWYNSINTNSEGRAWLCPCVTSASDAPASKSAGCRALPDATGTQPVEPSRRGMSSALLNGDWRTALHGLSGPNRRLHLLVEGKVRVTRYKRPFLVLEIGNETPKPEKRVRRSSSGSRECRAGTRVADASSPCCRSSFRVNVAEMGWQRWIVSPLEFDFHFCSGSCEQGGGLGFPPAASGLWAARDRDPTEAFLRARMTCCIPRRVSPLPVIITTDGFTTNRTFIPNFDIQECACFGLER